MKVGINLAADMLRRNIEGAIEQSGCPSVIVRAVLERELAAASAAEQRAIQREAAAAQKEQEEQDKKETEKKKESEA